MGRFGGGGGGSSSGSQTLVPGGVIGGRLSVDVSNPVPDVGAASNTLRLLPYNGDRVALHNGAAWVVNMIPAGGVLIDNTGLLVDTNYDVFLFNNSGPLALQLVAWADATNRATGLIEQDGVKVLAGDTSRRYMGTVRTQSGAALFVDTPQERFVWNNENRRRRSFFVDGFANHNYVNGGWRQIAADPTKQVEAVFGLAEDLVELEALCGATHSTGAGSAQVGIGLDATGANVARTAFGRSPDDDPVQHVASYRRLAPLGHHFFAWLQNSPGVAGTVNFDGTDAGLTGSILA